MAGNINFLRPFPSWLGDPNKGGSCTCYFNPHPTPTPSALGSKPRLKWALEPMGKLRPGWEEGRAQCPDL